MDSLSYLEKKLKEIAGLIGVIQSLAWIFMAVMCIVIHYTTSHKYYPSYHYMDAVGDIIYQLFLRRSHQELYFSGQSLTPGVFAFFLWVYVIIDLSWFIYSWQVLLQKKGNLRLVYQIWSANTALVCLVDLILVIILGANYDKCLSENSTSFEVICAVGILPVLVIAAKGFVLWIVNVMFAVLLLYIAKQLQQVRTFSFRQFSSHFFYHCCRKRPSTISCREPLFKVPPALANLFSNLALHTSNHTSTIPFLQWFQLLSQLPSPQYHCLQFDKAGVPIRYK
ncbi:unnamed protein product [Tenebrio molitor]|nr:unnamed protein product [Tenebrio molitor]